jgi:hypothetical protein
MAFFHNGQFGGTSWYPGKRVTSETKNKIKVVTMTRLLIKRTFMFLVHIQPISHRTATYKIVQCFTLNDGFQLAPDWNLVLILGELLHEPYRKLPSHKRDKQPRAVYHNHKISYSRLRSANGQTLQCTEWWKNWHKMRISANYFNESIRCSNNWWKNAVGFKSWLMTNDEHWRLTGA